MAFKASYLTLRVREAETSSIGIASATSMRSMENFGEPAREYARLLLSNFQETGPESTGILLAAALAGEAVPKHPETSPPAPDHLVIGKDNWFSSAR